MRLYFQIDLTGNLIMIEKLVLGEIWTGDLLIFIPDALTSAPSWHCSLIILGYLTLQAWLPTAYTYVSDS